jgi:hypothetical protein
MGGHPGGMEAKRIKTRRQKPFSMKKRGEKAKIE